MGATGRLSERAAAAGGDGAHPGGLGPPAQMPQLYDCGLLYDMNVDS